MLTSLEQLRKFKLQATDGEIGRVRDVLVEEGNWTARWWPPMWPPGGLTWTTSPT